MGKIYLCIAALLILSAPGSVFAADFKNGQLLFNDPELGNGHTGKTCFTCHEQGTGLGKNLSSKKEFKVMGIEINSIEEVIIFCLEVTLRGEEIDPKEMQDLKAYLIELSHNGEKAGTRWND